MRNQPFAPMVYRRRHDFHGRTPAYVGQLCQSRACSMPGLSLILLHLLAKDFQLRHKSTLKALWLWQFCHVIWYRVGGVCNSWAR